MCLKVFDIALICRNIDIDNKKNLDESSLVFKTVRSSKAHCRNKVELSKTKPSIEETSPSDKCHDFNSREGIANILKGTLIPGVSSVSPGTRRILSQSSSKSLTAKNRRPYDERSNLKVIVRKNLPVIVSIYLKSNFSSNPDSDVYE